MHEKFLLAALEQAKLGQGLCAPNPSVGAVVVQNNSIVAQAWHKGAGTAHAEPLLLAQLPPKMPDVTLYVTLEPCNHWGRTPPCVDAIIDFGIKRVVFAYADPNPVVMENNSSAILRAQGIEVIHVPLAAIDDFYKCYAYWTATGRPWVTVKIAQTFDGKIASEEGACVTLSNALCSRFTHERRREADVILTSSRTIHRDNPALNVRLEGSEQAKPVAIVDRDLSLDHNARIFSTASHCHIYHREKNRLVGYANSSYHPVNTKDNRLDLNEIIGHLGNLGYHEIWVEAGGGIFSALHQQGLVNRTYVYLVPKVLSVRAVSAYQAAGLFDRPFDVSWQVAGDNMIACLDWR